jgi:hypothetical protein
MEVCGQSHALASKPLVDKLSIMCLVGGRHRSTTERKLRAPTKNRNLVTLLADLPEFMLSTFSNLFALSFGN